MRKLHGVAVGILALLLLSGSAPAKAQEQIIEEIIIEEPDISSAVTETPVDENADTTAEIILEEIQAETDSPAVAEAQSAASTGTEQKSAAETEEAGTEQESAAETEEAGTEQGSAAEVSETGTEQESAAEVSEAGTEQGSAAEVSETGTEQESAAETEEAGTEQGSAAEVSETGTEQGSAAEVSETGMEQESAAAGETEGVFGEEALSVASIEIVDPDEEELEDQSETQKSVVKGAVNITVSKESIASLGTRRAIQNALNEAKENASASAPYTVTVEAGSYTIDSTLFIYGNTTLKLTGVTLIRGEDNKNMIRVGDLIEDCTEGVTGYYYKNIAIEGGTLDGNSAQNCTGTMVKAGHTQGFTMQGVTLQNCLNAHIMETAGVKDMTISKCSFLNQITDGTGNMEYYNEAIQLDVLIVSHMNHGYRSEDLPTVNVVIDSCTFTNVQRGVGSHTAILNRPMSNVSVTNCTFTQIKGVAVQFLYTKNLTIANNTISDAPRGIVINQATSGVFLPSVIAGEGGLTASASDAYTAPGNQNIRITGNQITMGSEDNPYADEMRVGIYAYGSADIAGTGLPDGDYYVNGVTISQNTINNVTGHGIRLLDVRNADISSNTITYASMSFEEDFYGISLRESPGNGNITGNNVTGAPVNGLFVCLNSSVESISGNTFSDSGNNGIYINTDSSADTIKNNVVTGAGNAGIAVNSAKVGTVSGNTVKSCKVQGIYAGNNSAVNNVKDNVIESPGQYGIRFVGGATGNLIENNKITGATVSDIRVDSKSRVDKIVEYVALQAPVLSSVKNVSSGISVSWKTVSGADGYRIYRKTGSGKWKKVKTVAAGTLTYTDKSVKSSNGKAYSYAVKAYSADEVSELSAKKTIYRLTAPTISSLKNTSKKTMTVKWKKNAKCTGYQIKYVTGKTKKTVNITKKSTLKKVISSLKKKATYKVYIRCYLKKSGTTWYSAWSSAKSVKIKK